MKFLARTLPVAPFAGRVLLLVVLAASGAGVSAAVAAQDTPMWFVLRHETSGDCWTGKLISIAGQYARGSALIAGGPYASEAEALARLADLRQSGACKGE